MRWLPLLVAVLVGAACSKNDSGREATDPVSDPMVTTESADIASPKAPALPAAPEPPAEPPRVELLKSGRKPRGELRWALEAGSTQKLRIETVAQLTGAVGGMLRLAKPPQRIVWDVTVTTGEVGPSGTAKASLRVDEVEVLEPGIAREVEIPGVKRDAEALVGTTASYTIDPQGLLSTFHLDFPAEGSVHTFNLLDSLQKTLELTLLRVPKEPVGVGATWEVTRGLRRDGAVASVASVAKLTKLQNGVASFTLADTGRAEPQAFVVRGLPDVVYDLKQMTTKAATDITWDLSKAAPSSASTEDEVVQTIQHGKGSTIKIIVTTATTTSQ